MKITATLSRYMARIYTMNMFILLLALLAVVYLFDMVELIRRASKHDDVPLSLVMQMGLLKLPEVGQMLLPFAILFSAMYTFWHLTRRYELIVVRASGFSVWQFLTPVILVAMCVGLLQVMIVNPLGALLVSRFEQLENTYLNREDSQIAIFKEGLWLRQSTQDGYVILHAAKVQQPEWILKNVMVLFFSGDDSFQKRINAQSALLHGDRWIFEGVTIYKAQEVPNAVSSYTLPTKLTIKDVEDSFSSPASMSFWRLPSHIRTLEDTGFDASRLRIQYQSLLAQPFLFLSMVLLAASVSMRPPRSRGTLILAAAGVLIGFILFFMSSFLQALGASQQIPVLLAAWSPALISFLLGLSAVMNLEDG